jgi:hypothetical protein
MFNRWLYHTALSDGCQALLSDFFILFLTFDGSGPEKAKTCPRKCLSGMDRSRNVQMKLAVADGNKIW